MIVFTKPMLVYLTLAFTCSLGLVLIPNIPDGVKGWMQIIAASYPTFFVIYYFFKIKKAAEKFKKKI